MKIDKVWLSQLKQPNFDYPQMHNNQKIIHKLSLLHSYLNEPFYIQKNPSIFERTHLMPKLSKMAIFFQEYEDVLANQVRKAYICFCLDDEDSFEDEIDECMIEELAVLKSSHYIFQGSHMQWDSN